MSSLLEGQIRTPASTAMPAATRRKVLTGPPVGAHVARRAEMDA